MVEVLRERMKEMTNISYAVMDGQALELEDASFDRAARSFAMMLFPDRDLELADAESVWGMMTVGAPPAKMLFDRVGAEGKKRVR